ncbi:MAG: HD domain-containing protein [Treponema sp.]|jgi:GTP pyrophosphokinase|nr:HD domain-containing protein [Treponema sp.]
MEAGLSAFKKKIAIYEARDQARILRALYGEPGPPPAETPGGSGSPGSPGEKSAGQDAARLRRSLEITGILTSLNLDSDTLIAALILNCGATAKSLEPGLIAEQFGPRTALLAEGAAKIADIQAKNKTIREAENIRKMLFAMAQDIRVIFIKLAEKLCVLRSLDSVPVEEQKPAAQECLDIYAPLADRLGISWIKDELEDLSLKYLNRETYQQIKKIVAEKRGERQEFLSRAQEEIRREAAAAGITIEVNSRAKHFYSIYQKMRKRNKNAGDVYDLFGIRILCDSIENCYTLLGLVHRLWKPLEGRFKDYIAMPKSNGYQSLHTTVMSSGPDDEAAGESGGRQLQSSGESLAPSGGRMLEIQIRTREMHHIAENGIASHWLYKQGAAKDLVRPVDISIVNRLRDWKSGNETEAPPGSGSFLEDIKRELLGDSIYVFTPQGKVIELPAGATPIDFAYSIHSAVGEHCVGAKADGSIIPLSSELRNTQVVEILTSPSAHPHLNWLRLVKTARARSKIRSWLEQNDDSIIIEKNVVAKKKPSAPEPAPAPAKDFSPVQRVIQQDAAASILHVRVEDEKNLMIRFARCCRPVTGDPIIGYVSRGRGIIIHRRNCSNLANIPDFEERKIEAEWENAGSALVKHFKIEARLSADLFSEIEGAVRKHQGHLIEGRLEETAPNRLTGFFTMQLESAATLKRVVKNIQGVPGMYRVQILN